ncbi:MAG: HEPN domain-containing protein [Candidatus Omnitrophota bacterium]
MNENNYAKEKAKEWIGKGDNDIRTAEIVIKDNQPPTDTICFHCQQAVEKYLKGYLTGEKINFLKSHDLDYLLKLCVESDRGFERYRETVLILNKYGIEPRYPADIPIYYSIKEAKQAIELANDLLFFIIKKVEKRAGKGKGTA